MFKFAELNYLWLLWLIPIIIFWYVASSHRKKIKIQKLIAEDLWKEVIPSYAKKSNRGLKLTLLILGLSFICITLLRPQWGYELREIKRRGVDLFVLVDTSDSMLASDIKPNRMERAKRELIDLLQYLSGDRIGLIAFAGDSYVACPLTQDYSAFSLFIDHLNTSLIPSEGTNIGSALNRALESFGKGDSQSKAIILITDGESTVAQDSSLLERIQKENIRVYIIGMGSEKGAPIPLPEGDGFYKDQQGKVVISKLNESSLKELALSTGGTYVRSVTGDLDLEQIYLKGIKNVLKDKELKSSQKQIPLERFQIPLFLALLFLGVETFIKEIRAS